jgi:formylglycine-generating enzyme required for sulfatase activity
LCDYCPEVEHTCLEWMDPPGSRYAHFRCARYAKTATCKKPKRHVRFCIDVAERREEASELPARYQSFNSSETLCKKAGGRLCKESEWQFACEGEEMRPYPYGWERDSTACNVDIASGLGKTGRLVDHRSTAAEHPRCASPFGVLDMAGNMEEWVVDEGAPVGLREAMKGSWWIPSRHACAETGTRCCKDP